MFKNQLLLVVRFKDDRIFVEAFDFSYRLYTANQENGDRRLIAAHSVEIYVLDVLGRCLVFHRNSLKSYERFQKLTDLVLNFIAVSRSIKPGDLRLFAKPSHLTFGITPRITLDYTNRLVMRDRGIDTGDDMPIADGFKRLRTRGHTARKQPSDFIYQTSLKHAADPFVDPSV